MKNKIDWSGAQELPSNGIDWSGAEEVQSQPNLPMGGFGDVLKGGAIGSVQGLSDFGALIASLPSKGYELFKGHPLYETPRPDFRKYYPESQLGKASGNVAEFVAPLSVPGLGFGGDIARGVRGVYRGATSVPLTAKMSARPLQLAKKIAEKREINNLKIPNEIFSEAKDFLPKSAPYKKLLQNAKKGNYQDLFTLQSDMGKVSRTLSRSPSGAERLHAEAASDLRSRLIGAMKESLEKEGHKDIAQLMSKGQKGFRTYKNLEKTVYPKVRKAAMFGLAGMGIPTTFHGIERILKGD